jgi:hypothetical protein
MLKEGPGFEAMMGVTDCAGAIATFTFRINAVLYSVFGRIVAKLIFIQESLRDLASDGHTKQLTKHPRACIVGTLANIVPV